MTMIEQSMLILAQFGSRFWERWVPRGKEGAIMTEYVVLLGLVAIGAATALAAWGPPLYVGFIRSRTILMSPFP